MSQQPLKLKNPTSYHLMQTGGYNNNHSPHPLAPMESSPFQFHKESSEHPIDFHDSFSQHIMHPMSSPLSSEYDEHQEYQHLYDRSSFSSSTAQPMVKKVQDL